MRLQCFNSVHRFPNHNETSKSLQGETNMKTSVASSLCVLVIVAASSVASATTIYSQNFDSMGTGTAAPAGWSVYSISGSHDTFTPADDTTNTGVLPTGPAISGGTLESTLTVATANQSDTSSAQKGLGGFNWAVNGSSTNRSLGTSPSGNAATVLHAVIANNTGAGITDISIDYDVLVQTTTTMNNNYPSNGYVGIEELPGYELFYSLDGTNYTNVTALNGNGHTWANLVGTVHESQADLNLGGTWAAGANLTLLFFDDNAQGPSPDQKLGLDNVVIGTVATPEPVTMVLLAIGGMGILARRKRN
jgi:hypothetical protein